MFEWIYRFGTDFIKICLCFGGAQKKHCRFFGSFFLWERKGVIHSKIPFVKGTPKKAIVLSQLINM
jgi:hypothetical protein